MTPARSLLTFDKFNKFRGGYLTWRGFSTGANRWQTPLPMSNLCARTFNPIREIVDRLSVEPPQGKPMIPLSIGDPTIFGNFAPPSTTTESLISLLDDGRNNGYVHSSGIPEARAAIADQYRLEGDLHPLEDDVIIACGCSQAIDLALCALMNEGDTLAIPKPAFSLYRCLATARGFKVVTYDLLPEKDWECDLNSLEEALKMSDVVLFNNPSNPCGSVWSWEHTRDVARMADLAGVPILSDEIYADMTFGERFVPMQAVATSPLLVVGGLAKQYMAPGWRVGWIVICDPVQKDLMSEIRQGLNRLSTLTLGPTSFIQAGIPEMLRTRDSYFKRNLHQLADNARIFSDGLAHAPGVRVVEPGGAMYVMVEFDCERLGFEDDIALCEALISEEGVVLLPGQCFEIKNFARGVISAPPERLMEATERITEFCQRHAKS